MKIDRRSMLVCVAMAASFTFCNAFAHITNEASQGPDVGASGLGGDIMLLVVAEIMPETPDFAPDAPLSRFDLASWAALAADLGEGGETPDTDALAAAALQQGLVESIEGQATYAEINDLLFHGQLADYRPAATPTGGEAARYIAAQLSTAAGATLLQRRGLRFGPVGEVVRVESRSNPDGGSTYVITIGATSLPIYVHARVGNGPVDLARWQGRTVRRSLIRELDEMALWTYLEGEPLEVSARHKHE